MSQSVIYLRRLSGITNSWPAGGAADNSCFLSFFFSLFTFFTEPLTFSHHKQDSYPNTLLKSVEEGSIWYVAYGLVGKLWKVSW